MTIQEVIEHCERKLQNWLCPPSIHCKTYWEHFNVKKWLEELSILREEVANLRKKLASLEEEKVKFRWHDLTVSEDDLPECEEITEYLVYDGTYYYVYEWIPHKRCWTDDGLLYDPDRVVRWREIDRSHERKEVEEE